MIYAYNGENLFQNCLPTDDQLLGPLPDALTCEIERDTDGLFSLSMTYPMDGKNADYLAANIWLCCPAGGRLGQQYFRICNAEEIESGVLSIQADHASYNANYIIVPPFTAATSEKSETVAYYPWWKAMENSVKKIKIAHKGGFSVVGYTDALLLNAARYTEPVSMRDAVLNAAQDRDILVLADNLSLKLWQTAGSLAAPSFEIRYGRNLTTYQNGVNAEDFYTHIYPYTMVGDSCISYYDMIFKLDNVPPEYDNVRRVKPVNLTGLYGVPEDFDLALIDAVLGGATDLWIKDHPFVDFPREIAVGAIPDEGNTYELAETGDIYFTPSGFKTRATIVSLRYDVLLDRVTSIGVGRIGKDVTDAMAALANR